ncbi:MAG TPA: chemotaxis protein CheW [Blastocatellia bacterium]|nr:chemotaxis protein CheW [Blastocatellia bacterium]
MRRQVIVFKVGDGEFAVDIMAIREVKLMQEITPVPETPEYVEGVLNLRGSLVPVLDLRKRMRAGRRAVTDQTRIIIARPDDKLVGLIVDHASDFIRVNDEEVDRAPEMLSEIGATYVTGVIRRDHRVIALIDLKKALGEAVFDELDGVIEALAQTAAGVIPMQAAQR